MRAAYAGLALGLALGLAACGNAADMPVAAPGADIIADDAEGVAQTGGTSDYVDPNTLSRDGFTQAPIDGLEPGMDVDAAEPVLRAAAPTGEGGYAVSKLYAGDGRTILLATQDGVGDDSIAAVQIYAEFLPISPLQTSLEYTGVRQKCARGANTTEWTTEPCP